MPIEKLQTLCKKQCDIFKVWRGLYDRPKPCHEEEDRNRDKNFSNLKYKPNILFKHIVHTGGDATNKGLGKKQILIASPDQCLAQSVKIKSSILNSTISSSPNTHFTMTPALNFPPRINLRPSVKIQDQHNRFSLLEDEIKMNDFKQKVSLIPNFTLSVSKCQPKQTCLDFKTTKDDCFVDLDTINSKHHSLESEILRELFSWKNFHYKPPDISVYLMKSSPSVRPKDLMVGTSGIYRNEGQRILTFSRYPRDAEKSALLLAENGFIYKGSGKKKNDRVRCVFCGVEKQNWRRKDKIKAVHKRTCSMRTNRHNLNNPLNLNLSHINKNQLTRKLFKIPYKSSKHYELVRSHPIQWAKKSVLPIPTEAELQTSQLPRRLTSQWLQESQHPEALQYPRSVMVTNLSESQILENSPRAIINEATALSSEVNITVASPNSNSVLIQEEIAMTQPETVAPLTTVSETRTADTQTQQASFGISPQQPVAEQGVRSLAESRPRHGRDPTYEELGIITERPKRTEYALRIKRLETFASWPRDHHLLPEELADAGFYFAGYGDCARCFFCGGGLRNWEDEDNVWVEHARWFPKCAYIRQLMGQVFVNTVQGMNTEFDKITMAMVTEKMGLPTSTFQLDTLNTPLKRDAAVRSVVSLGYQEIDTVEITQLIKQEGGAISAEAIINRLVQEGKRPTRFQDEAALSNFSNTQALETIRELNERNGQLRQQTICKICMDKEVAVVFLPCGHLVSCSECASAMRNCPLCRVPVRGIVRAFMS